MNAIVTDCLDTIDAKAIHTSVQGVYVYIHNNETLFMHVYNLKAISVGYHVTTMSAPPMGCYLNSVVTDYCLSAERATCSQLVFVYKRLHQVKVDKVCHFISFCMECRICWCSSCFAELFSMASRVYKSHHSVVFVFVLSQFVALLASSSNTTTSIPPTDGKQTENNQTTTQPTANFSRSIANSSSSSYASVRLSVSPSPADQPSSSHTQPFPEVTTNSTDLGTSALHATVSSVVSLSNDSATVRTTDRGMNTSVHVASKAEQTSESPQVTTSGFDLVPFSVFVSFSTFHF